MEENRKKLHNSSINTIKIILIIILFLIIFSIALLIYYKITKITNETNDNSNNIQTGNNYSVSNEPLRKENITQEEGIELASIKIAQKLKAAGAPISLICQSTGLTEEEVATL